VDYTDLSFTSSKVSAIPIIACTLVPRSGGAITPVSAQSNISYKFKETFDGNKITVNTTENYKNNIKNKMAANMTSASSATHVK